jgi:hypothetical protein
MAPVATAAAWIRDDRSRASDRLPRLSSAIAATRSAMRPASRWAITERARWARTNGVSNGGSAAPVALSIRPARRLGGRQGRCHSGPVAHRPDRCWRDKRPADPGRRVDLARTTACISHDDTSQFVGSVRCGVAISPDEGSRQWRVTIEVCAATARSSVAVGMDVAIGASIRQHTTSDRWQLL